MNRSTVGNRWNLGLIEENYRLWRAEPGSVPESWRNFFEGYELALADGAPPGGAPPAAGPPAAARSWTWPATRPP